MSLVSASTAASAQSEAMAREHNGRDVYLSDRPCCKVCCMCNNSNSTNKVICQQYVLEALRLEGPVTTYRYNADSDRSCTYPLPVSIFLSSSISCA